MKPTVKLIIILCIVNSLGASDIYQKTTQIVHKVKNSLYTLKSEMTGPTADEIKKIPEKATVCFRFESQYAAKILDNKDITNAFGTLEFDIVNLVKSEQLKTHSQFLKAYHAHHPCVVYTVICVCTLSLAHSLYTVINNSRKKQTRS